MKSKRRTRLSLEPLEDRFCPALSVSFQNSLLTLTGSPVGQVDVIVQNGSGAVKVTENAGATNLGTFNSTRGVRLQLTNHPGIVNFDLNGNSYGGSVLIDVGQGDPVVGGGHPINVFSSVAGGTLTGALTLQNGNGQENYSLGETGKPVTITGNVTVTGKHAAGTGNTLLLVDNSTLTGNLTVSKVENVDIGDGTGTAVGAVRGNASINDSDAGLQLSVNVLGVVGGNLSIQGSNAGNLVTFIQSHGAGSGVVGGSVSANLATSPNPASDKFTMSANTVIGSNLTVTGGGAGETVSIAGAIGGSATFNLGNGTNSVTLGPTVGILNQTFAIGGAVNVTMGNGTNTFDIKGNASSSIGGSVYTTMGNGTNVFVMNGGAVVSGPVVSYRGGTLSDTVQIINGLSNSFALNVTFFGGTRTVELGTGISLGSMTLNFGTGPGTKTLTYDPPPVTITWPTMILNFP